MADEKTMEEMMGEVFDSLQAAEPVEEATEAEPVETAEAPENAEEAADGPLRGPDGKFIAKEQPVEPEAAPEDEITAEAPPTEAAAEAPPSAPESWSAAAKAEWGKLPPAIQQEVLKREGDVARGFDERAARLKTYEPIEQVIAPRRNQLVAGYGSEAAAIKELFDLSDYAARDPRGFIDMFARSRGIDLGQPAAPQETADPNDPMAALQRQIADLTNQIQSREQAERQRETEQLAQTVEQFKASGNAPYFEEVRMDMIGLSRAFENDTIEQLYERAVFANPTVRQRILEDQRAKERAEQEAARKAEEAKRIARVNVSQRGAAGAAPGPKRTMEEEMAEVYERVNSAA